MKAYYVGSCVWLLSCSIRFSRFALAVARISSSFLSMTNSTPLHGYGTFCWLVPLSVGLWMFSVWELMNGAAMNEYTSFCLALFSILLGRYVPNGRVLESHGHSVFKLLRTSQAVSHRAVPCLLPWPALRGNARFSIWVFYLLVSLLFIVTWINLSRNVKWPGCFGK